MRTLFPAEGPRRVWPPVVIKPRDFHVSTVWLADRWPLLRNRRIFSSPVRDGRHSLFWSVGAPGLSQLMSFNSSLGTPLYPSKEVARGHSEVAVINLSDAW